MATAPAARADRAKTGPRPERRRELAEFLRSRRNRLTPEAVGLPPAPRRKTPGLRREEVATLAGVGVTWYTWLEQGRPINASPQVLSAVARVLRLDPSEHEHLFALAGGADAPDVPQPQLPAALRDILDALSPNPASVIGPRWDVLAYNTAEAALMGDYDQLPPGRRNLLWLMFTEPAWRAMMLDWETDAARLVGQFRSSMAHHAKEKTWTGLVDDLTAASTDFRDLWDRHDVTGPATRIKRYQHPAVGLLRFHATHLLAVDPPGARIITYTPADQDTRTRLADLATTPPRNTWAPTDNQP